MFPELEKDVWTFFPPYAAESSSPKGQLSSPSSPGAGSTLFPVLVVAVAALKYQERVQRGDAGNKFERKHMAALPISALLFHTKCCLPLR